MSTTSIGAPKLSASAVASVVVSERVEPAGLKYRA
jgi:hypothetical protein